MSELSVNIISPRTDTKVEILGIDPPTFQGQPLALEAEVVKVAGDTMTGPLVLSGDASSALHAVPLQQALVKSGNVGSPMTAPLILHNGAYGSLASEPLRAVTYEFLNSYLNDRVSKGNSDHNYATPGTGYQVFPGGLILNWMQVAISDPTVGSVGASGTATFPKAFPNACLFCMAGLRLTGGQSEVNIQVATSTWTTTQVGWQVAEWSAAVNPINLLFLAIGH